MTNNAVVVNNNGTIMKTYCFQGRDTDVMPEEDVDHYVLSINNVVKRLNQDYMLFWESQKIKDEEYFELSDNNELQREFDTDRVRRINKDCYSIRSYLTICYKQPSQTYDELGKIIDADDKTVWKTMKSLGKDFINVFNPKASMANLDELATRYRENFDKVEEDFTDQCDQITGMLSRIFTEIRPLTPQEMLTYLHSTISDSPHEIKADIRSFIAQRLSDSTLISGRSPKLGKYHMGILGVKDYPQETFPDILGKLRSIKSSYRYCVRYIAIDSYNAKKESLKLVDQHNQRSKSMVTYMLESISQKDSGKVDESALMDAEEARQAAIDIEQGLIGLGYLTINIVLLNENEEELAEDLKDLRDTVNEGGFVSVIESDNAVKAYLSTIPSVYEYNVRRYLLPSLTMIAVAPITSVWEGQKKNKHLKGDALLKVKTRESLRFYLSLHVDDVGHTFIAGPTGAGKSVLLNTISAHFQKYKNARVYIFDKSASSRVLTEAMGGTFYNLLVDTKSISFQPLARVTTEDNDTERQWIVSWLSSYAESRNIQIDEKDRRTLNTALITIAGQPLEDRTLTALSLAVQSEKWRLALSSLLINDSGGINSGLYGALFDSNEDKFGSGRWQAFEMDRLMQDESVVALTLDYLFHRIESTLTGDPTLIVLDECWLFLMNEQFKKKIIDYIRTLRKANASIIMATQNLSDITEDMIPIVTNNMETKIFLANRNMNSFNRNTYELFGCNAKEIELISQMQPKGEYFYKSKLGSRIFDLGLINNVADPAKRPTVESIFLTSTDVTDQAKAIEIKSRCQNSKEFIDAWKAYKPYERGK